MNKKNLSLYHLIQSPSPPHEKPPVLFLLHGYGSDEADLFALAPELPAELCIISVRAPYTMPYGYAWYNIYFGEEEEKWSDNDQARESRELVAAFIEEACEAYNLDTARVTLLGFSQGCVLSYAVALSYPEKVRNVIALSGYLNEPLLKESYRSNDFSQLHIYCSHGISDAVIPVEWARKTAKQLDGLGIAYLYEEFPAGHGINFQNFAAFRKWLIAHLS